MKLFVIERWSVSLYYCEWGIEYSNVYDWFLFVRLYSIFWMIISGILFNKFYNRVVYIL